jgi:phosphoglycolate phosphatase
MPIRLILYDLDGTLVDTRVDLANAVNQTLSELGLPNRPDTELYGYIGHGVRMLLARAVGAMEGEVLENALTVFRGHYLAHLTDHSRPYPGVDEALSTFADRHQAVLTNKAMAYTEPLLRGLGITERVNLVLGGDSTPHLKPHPAMVQAALDHFGVAPREAVMVGDGVPDVEASRAAGVRSIGLVRGMGNPDLLLGAKPDFVVDHMPQAIPVIRSLDGRPAAGEA